MKNQLIGAVTALILVLVGFVAARVWFPRVEIQVMTIDREIVRTLERTLPGETKIIFRDVPGATQIVRIPIEVTRIIEKEGPERIVTVTKPVEVPVEVVKKEWPQVITVTVGSVQSNGQWYAPDNPDLVIGQVAPGVYAVPVQAGWRIEQVRTVTRLEPVRLEPLMQRGFTLGARAEVWKSFQAASADLVYKNLLGPGEYSIRLPVASAEFNAGQSSFRVGVPSGVMFTWDARW